jgi:hypothetical protein
MNYNLSIPTFFSSPKDVISLCSMNAYLTKPCRCGGHCKTIDHVPQHSYKPNNNFQMGRKPSWHVQQEGDEHKSKLNWKSTSILHQMGESCTQFAN